MSTLTSSDVRQIVQDARDEGLVPNLSGEDLYGVDLSDSDLCDVNLYGVDLSGANLSGTNLRGADLTYANLYGANLYGASLRGTNLRGADLTYANLSGTNLYEANLYGANLYDANLQRVVGWDGLHMINLHPYPIHLTATPERWVIRIGCWEGNPDELEILISQDEGWPESTGEKILKNRALLTAAMVVIHTHIGAHPTAIDDAVKAHENWK